MFGEYRYEIEKIDGGFEFVLYPGNIPHQRIGQSQIYCDEKLCRRALNEFVMFVKENSINQYMEPFTQIEKVGSHYYLKYLKDNKVVFSTRGYEHKQSAKKIISGVYKNRDCRK